MILTEKQLLQSKTKEIAAIFGCGYSINTITTDEWEFISNNCDTMAFNWFCLGNVPIIPKYYLAHVQGVYQSHIDAGYGYEDFHEKLKADIVLILKKEKNKKRIYAYHENTDRFEKVVVFNPSEVPVDINLILKNPFEGAYNPRTALGFMMHIAVFLGYKTIIFYGVDLYDQRYYWCDYDETWDLINVNNWEHEYRHPHEKTTVEIVQRASVITPHIKWVVHNRLSSLAKMIEVK